MDYVDKTAVAVSNFGFSAAAERLHSRTFVEEGSHSIWVRLSVLVISRAVLRTHMDILASPVSSSQESWPGAVLSARQD